MVRPLLIVPGLDNSSPDHWQSRWEAALPQARRVRQANWSEPKLGSWLNRLAAAVRRRPGCVLIAHSLGCILAAHLGARPEARQIAGALLVAPPDLEQEGPARLRLQDFAPTPTAKLPFPAVVVASRSDPYATYEATARTAAAWDASLLDYGDAGHINVDSGHGPWPDGLLLLEDLLRSLEPRLPSLGWSDAFRLPEHRAQQLEIFR